MRPTRRLTQTLTLILPLLSLPAHAQQSCNPSIPETTPTSTFTFHASGTVTDNRTGLEWKRCLEGQTFNASGPSCDGTATTYTWRDALAAATASTFDGGGWRLPNLNELASIVERRCFSPAANLDVFPNLGTSSLWSASPYARIDSFAWNLNFGNGNDNENSFDRRSRLRVRLVRAGQ